MYLTLVLLIVLTIFVIIKPNKKQEVNVIKEAKGIKNFAIYKDDGSSNYAISSDISFPTKGYLLNLDKTKCYDSNNNDVSNSIVSQSLDGKITLQATQASYCDLYFAKDDDVPVVNTFTIIGSKENNATLNSGYSHKVNVTYSISWTASDVVSYCISTSQSSCNGNWVNVSGTSVSPTEPVLDSTEGKKTRYAFLKDRANNISVGKEASITLDLNNPTVSNVTYKSKDTNSITVNVTGSDTANGSSVVKYECSAKEKGVWFTQDTNGNCKVTGLNDGTEYTIEGRVTDASGRVSTNNVSTTQSTEAAYSCSTGEELVQDAQKGSSSRGYICKASASSKGWYSSTSYYTCSETSDRYSTRSSAESACKNAKKGTCSKKIVYGCMNSYGALDFWSTDRSTAARECETAGYYAKCERYDDNSYSCHMFSKDGKNTGFPNWLNSKSECESKCDVSYALFGPSDAYVCSVGHILGDFESSCNSACVGDGMVSTKSDRSYFCGSGWYTYSGDGSSLECYRPATKG